MDRSMCYFLNHSISYYDIKVKLKISSGICTEEMVWQKCRVKRSAVCQGALLLTASGSDFEKPKIVYRSRQQNYDRSFRFGGMLF